MTRKMTDEELEAAFGTPEPPMSIEDLAARFDRLELDIWGVKDRLTGMLGAICIALLLIIYKLFG